jgi:hypothetical protein
LAGVGFGTHPGGQICADVLVVETGDDTTALTEFSIGEPFAEAYPVPSVGNAVGKGDSYRQRDESGTAWFPPCGAGRMMGSSPISIVTKGSPQQR